MWGCSYSLGVIDIQRPPWLMCEKPDFRLYFSSS